MPGVPFGSHVEHLPTDVGAVYTEARNCITANAFTACVLACRTLLIHIAAEKGMPNPERKSFQDAIDHLKTSHYTPPNADAWVDHIRNRGNAATHRLEVMERKDAETILVLVQMLLSFIYDYPNRVKP